MILSRFTIDHTEMHHPNEKQVWRIQYYLYVLYLGILRLATNKAKCIEKSTSARSVVEFCEARGRTTSVCIFFYEAYDRALKSQDPNHNTIRTARLFIEVLKIVCIISSFRIVLHAIIGDVPFRVFMRTKLIFILHGSNRHGEKSSNSRETFAQSNFRTIEIRIQ